MPKQNNSAEGGSGSDLSVSPEFSCVVKVFPQIPQFNMLCIDKSDKYFVFLKKIPNTTDICDG